MKTFNLFHTIAITTYKKLRLRHADMKLNPECPLSYPAHTRFPFPNAMAAWT